MTSKTTGWLIGLTIIVALSVPAVLFKFCQNADVVSAWGQWVSDAIITIAAILAVRQLSLTQTSSETDVFLKICDMVDDEKFLEHYENVLRDRSKLLSQPIVLGGLDAFPETDAFNELKISATYVLSEFEKIGILIHHANVDKRMVSDFIGAYVVDAFAALSAVVAYDQTLDKELHERFAELNDMCSRFGWKSDRRPY